MDSIIGWLIIVVAIIFLFSYFVVILYTDFEKYKFLDDLMEISDETINGDYCIKFKTLENTFEKGKVIETNLIEKTKCVDATDKGSLFLYEKVQDKKYELKRLDEEPIKKELLRKQMIESKKGT